MRDLGDIIDKQLTKANILRLISEEQLWRYYFGNFDLNRTYISPLRDDSMPSFSIFWASRMGKILGKDHNGSFLGDIFDFVGAKYKVEFTGSLIRVNNDLSLGLDNCGCISDYTPNTRAPITTMPRIHRVIYESILRPPLEEDIVYWNSYGITKHTLNLYGVRPVGVLYCNGMCCYTYTQGDPCCEYKFPSGNRKYYRPFASKELKFRGNIDNDKDIQGYYKIREKKWIKLDEWCNGEIIVLTKSMKDIMLLHEYNIDSMAIHGEQHKFKDDFIRHIKERYKKVVSLYDRDRSGMNGARRLWREYKIEPLFIKGAKDITDLYKKDKQKAEEFIIKINSLI